MGDWAIWKALDAKKTRYDNLIVQVFNVVSDCELFLSACVNPLQSDFSQHKK